jgi:hypothetical protein
MRQEFCSLIMDVVELVPVRTLVGSYRMTVRQCTGAVPTFQMSDSPVTYTVTLSLGTPSMKIRIDCVSNNRIDKDVNGW